MIPLTVLLQISASPLLNALIWIVVMGIIFYVIWWGLDKIALGQPFDKIIRVIMILAVVIILVNFLIGLLGSPF